MLLFLHRRRPLTTSNPTLLVHVVSTITKTSYIWWLSHVYIKLWGLTFLHVQHAKVSRKEINCRSWHHGSMGGMINRGCCILILNIMLKWNILCLARSSCSSFRTSPSKYLNLYMDVKLRRTIFTVLATACVGVLDILNCSKFSCNFCVYN